MKHFKCEEISCGHCVGRINKALTDANIKHNVDLDSKIVSIEEDKDLLEAVEILDDLGFSAIEQ